MKYLNNGTYGCVIAPNLKCPHTDANNKYVSKVFSSIKSARDELEQVKIMEKVDPYNRFTIKMLEACKVDAFRLVPKEEMIKCKNFDNRTLNNSAKQMQLIYEHGGIDLGHIKDMSFEDLFLDMRPLFWGLRAMNSKGITHYDIKPANIVYNPTTRKMAYIDFGLVHETSINYNVERFTKKYGSMQPFISYVYHYFPPEFKLYNSYKFELQHVNYTVIHALKQATYYEYTIGYNKFFNTYLIPIIEILKTHSPELENQFTTLFDNDLDSWRRTRFLEMIKEMEKYHGDPYFTRIEKKVDVYGLGISLLQILSMFFQNSPSSLDVKKYSGFYKQLFTMLSAMTDFNPMQRISSSQAYNMYKSLYEMLKSIGTSTRNKDEIPDLIKSPHIDSDKDRGLVERKKAYKARKTKNNGGLLRAIKKIQQKAEEWRANGLLPAKVRNPDTNRLIYTNALVFVGLVRKYGWEFWDSPIAQRSAPNRQQKALEKQKSDTI
jgi:serine/threonine protein kinase